MVQDVIVGLIVIASAIYTIWILMPAGMRRAGAAGIASLARSFGVGARESERLQARLATHGSCGDCEECKGCAPARKNNGASPRSPSEVR